MRSDEFLSRCLSGMLSLVVGESLSGWWGRWPIIMQGKWHMVLSLSRRASRADSGFSIWLIYLRVITAHEIAHHGMNSFHDWRYNTRYLNKGAQYSNGIWSIAFQHTHLVVCNRHNELESFCFACQKSHRQLWSYYSTFITVYPPQFTFTNTDFSQQDLRLRRRRVLDALDRTHFQWLVVFVAGVGFLADGYDVFPPTIAPKPSCNN